MAKEQYVVYQSPKPGHRKSAPILMSDTKSRQHLELMGWRQVEGPFNADPATVEVFTASAAKGGPVAVSPELSPYAEWDWDALWNEAAQRELEIVVANPGASREELIADLESHDESGEQSGMRRDAVPSDFAFPEGFTDAQIDALRDAGFDTAESLHAATDEALLGVKGIGAASVKRLREALTSSP